MHRYRHCLLKIKQHCKMELIKPVHSFIKIKDVAMHISSMFQFIQSHQNNFSHEAKVTRWPRDKSQVNTNISGSQKLILRIPSGR